MRSPGLHWSDVDLEAKEVTIQWSNWKGILGRPKSDKGYRTIPLADPLVDLLRERRRYMKADGFLGGRRRLVFPTQEGTPHKGTPLNKILKRACKEAGVLCRFTAHGLRRTWNNIARRLAGGLVVRSMIGHASEAMTDHYSLVGKDEKRATADAVVARMRATRGEHESAQRDPEDTRHESEHKPQSTSIEPAQESPATDAEAGAVNPEPSGGLLVDETVDDGLEPPPAKDPKPQ